MMTRISHKNKFFNKCTSSFFFLCFYKHIFLHFYYISERLKQAIISIFKFNTLLITNFGLANIKLTLID